MFQGFLTVFFVRVLGVWQGATGFDQYCVKAPRFDQYRMSFDQYSAVFDTVIFRLPTGVRRVARTGAQGPAGGFLTSEDF